MNKIELLAPAGNEESFMAAVNAGADAVYMGLGKHNARVMAKNFTLSSYINCINYAHIRGVKVYLTLNTLVLDEEIEEALKLLAKLYEVGLDAVLVQDLGLATLIHEIFPKLALHASTQMSVYSLEQVEFLKTLGFKRVVLARELTLDEIEFIAKNTDVELEVFSHGALCVSVSGQCLMSLAIGTRSANRGACAQPCRMRYTLYNGEEKLTPKTYLLSKKDIFTLDILNKLINSGVSSLKIEGRNKTPEYVALITSTYRKYIDDYYNKKIVNVDNKDINNLLQMFNRGGISHGYFDGVRYKETITQLSPKNNGIFLGEVIGVQGKLIKLNLKENIDLHDGIEIYSNKGVISTIVTCIKDSNEKIINKEVKKDNIVYLGDIKDNNIKIGDKVYKTSRYKLNQEMHKNIIDKNLKQRQLVLNVTIKKDSPVTLSTIINGNMYTYNTNIIPELSQSKDITLDMVYQAFSKTQENGVKFTKVVGYVENGSFLKVSQLNEIRRNFVEKVEEKFLVHNNIEGIEDKVKEKLSKKYDSFSKELNFSKNILSIYSYNKETDYAKMYAKLYNKKLERIDIQAKDFLKFEQDILHKYSKYNLSIHIPSFTLGKLDEYIKNNLERLLQNGIKTIVLGSFRYYSQIKKLKSKYDFILIADYSFNVCNTYAAQFIKSLGFDVVSPAFDATESQILKISNVLPVERVNDYITVMTSRYCILGAFVANRKNGESCSCPCLKGNYYIEDKFLQRYYIVCSNSDCVMQIVKDYKLKDITKNEKIYIRNNIL